MIWLKKLNLRYSSQDKYPYNVPAFSYMDSFEFNSPITIFVGENGSGKSTLLESIAIKSGLPSIGEYQSDSDYTFNTLRSFAKSVKLNYSINNHKGFFMRSEDAFGFTKHIINELEDYQAEIDRVNKEYANHSTFTKQQALMAYVGSKHELEKYYGKNPDAFSHGESFINVFQKRLTPNGLYLLDEPETPLSPIRQMSLMSLILEMVDKDCQFIIATHSPMLMALPGADIYSFDENRFIEYKDIESVNIMRDFLNNPESFIRHLK